MNLFYQISFTNLTRVHCMCFATFRTGDVSRRCTSWWRAGNSDWTESEFHETIDLNLLGYYGITYILTEKKALFRYFKFLKLFPSEIGNEQLVKNFQTGWGGDMPLLYPHQSVWMLGTAKSILADSVDSSPLLTKSFTWPHFFGHPCNTRIFHGITCSQFSKKRSVSWKYLISDIYCFE